MTRSSAFLGLLLLAGGMGVAVHADSLHGVKNFAVVHEAEWALQMAVSKALGRPVEIKLRGVSAAELAALEMKSDIEEKRLDAKWLNGVVQGIDALAGLGVGYGSKRLGGWAEMRNLEKFGRANAPQELVRMRSSLEHSPSALARSSARIRIQQILKRWPELDYAFDPSMVYRSIDAQHPDRLSMGPDQMTFVFRTTDGGDPVTSRMPIFVNRELRTRAVQNALAEAVEVGFVDLVRQPIPNSPVFSLPEGSNRLAELVDGTFVSQNQEIWAHLSEKVPVEIRTEIGVDKQGRARLDRFVAYLKEPSARENLPALRTTIDAIAERFPVREAGGKISFSNLTELPKVEIAWIGDIRNRVIAQARVEPGTILSDSFKALTAQLDRQVAIPGSEIRPAGLIERVAPRELRVVGANRMKLLVSAGLGFLLYEALESVRPDKVAHLLENADFAPYHPWDPNDGSRLKDGFAQEALFRARALCREGAEPCSFSMPILAPMAEAAVRLREWKKIDVDAPYQMPDLSSSER